MVEGHAVDHHEVLQVVFVRCVVPVPRHHIERREILCAGAQKQTNKDTATPTNKHKRL